MKILIVKTSSLGDIVHTFPVLEYLHKNHPGTEIDWVVEAPFAELLETHPYVNRVIKVETKNWRKAKNLKTFFSFVPQLKATHYDLLFDFQGNTKSGLITFLAKAQKKIGFGKTSVAEWPNLLATNIKINPEPDLNIRQDNLFLVQSYFQDLNLFETTGVALEISLENQAIVEQIVQNPIFNKRKKVMVCSGSAWKNKQMTLPSLTNFLSQVNNQSPCGFLLVWGNDSEKNDAQVIQSVFPNNSLVIDRLSLPALQNLMDHMDLVIAMDSLPLHLAGTTSTKTFGIFGASAAGKYQPVGSKHLSFQGTCPYGKVFIKRCPILRSCATGACIRNPIENELFEEFSAKKV